MKKIVLNSVLSIAIISFLPLGADASSVKVKKGDTLYSLSKIHNVSVSDIKKWNNILSDVIFVGQELHLENGGESPKKNTPPLDKNTMYSVKAGDTLWSVAQAHSLSVSNIQKANNLIGTTIHVGQVLFLGEGKVDSSPSNQAPPTPTPPVVVSPPNQNAPKGNYVVVKGDSLYKIALNHQMTVEQLRSINNLKTDMIFVGQVLSLATQNPSKGLDVGLLISNGKQFMGVPYVWGGVTPFGFDCSGFIQYVFKLQGVAVPRTTFAMWDSGGSLKEPATGDIVFFETYEKGASHAGIYIGGGNFIHAGSSTGVTIANLSNPYYKVRYLGAKQIH